VIIKKILKRILQISLALVILVAIWILALAFPQPFFSDSVSIDNITIYSDNKLAPGINTITSDIVYRLKTASMYDKSNAYDIFICNNQGLFEFFITLAMRDSHIQGLNLSLLGNSFISMTTVAALGRAHKHNPPYNIRTGSLAHVICHELAHNYHSDQIGLLNYRNLPMWKTEGIAEYGAHYGAIIKDSMASLEYRLSEYMDASNWHYGDSYVKQIYISELMVEYLIMIKNYSIDQVCDDSVQHESTYDQFLNWYNQKQLDSI